MNPDEIDQEIERRVNIWKNADKKMTAELDKLDKEIRRIEWFGTIVVISLIGLIIYLFL